MTARTSARARTSPRPKRKRKRTQTGTRPSQLARHLSVSEAIRSDLTHALTTTLDELAEARKKLEALESVLLMSSRASQVNLGGLGVWKSRAQSLAGAVRSLLMELARVNQDASRSAELNGTQWLRGSNWAQVMRLAIEVRAEVVNIENEATPPLERKGGSFR